MSALQIILAAVAALLVVLLFVRLRVRFEVSRERRVLFIGYGRSGTHFDYHTGRGRFSLFGITIRTFDLRRARSTATRAAADRDSGRTVGQGAARHRSTADFLRMLPRIGRATWEFLLGLIGDVIVEEAAGEIEAGFDRPDLTGQVYGYYQAVVAAAPGLAGRIVFRPDWTGASFDGSARIAVAWPLYKLVYRTGLWLINIGLMKIIRWAIGTKEGGRDVQ